MQIGFGVVNVIDPLNSTQVSITSNFYFPAVHAGFLICRGHYILIRALFASYNYIPWERCVWRGYGNDIVRVFGTYF